METRRALLVGIDKYLGSPLQCCVHDVNDIQRLIEFNGDLDKSRNFTVMKLCDEQATIMAIRENLNIVFADDTDVGLFYFSGHGYDDEDDGKIVTYDFDRADCGLLFSEILKIVNKSKCKNKIVVLDCCYSGFMGNASLIGDKSYLANGVTILTACRNNEYSVEIDGHGLFTYLLIEALKGGAADIMGRITPGSIYAYIDRSLGAFQQRPVFKSNVSTFVNLRNISPKISISEIRELPSLFVGVTEKYLLDPSYEFTNFAGSDSPNREPYCTEDHIRIFQLLQKFNQHGLVKPSTRKFMYEEAMENGSCELTELGKHYWYLVKNSII